MCLIFADTERGPGCGAQARNMVMKYRPHCKNAQPWNTSLFGWLILLAPALNRLYGKDGDDMRMIGYEMRESPERHLPTLFERTGEIF